MKESSERKVSSIVAISVTILAVVTALAFSFASRAYQQELSQLKKINAEHKKTIEGYRAVLEDIKKQVSKVEVR